jgi:hypothetical protein
MNSAQAISKALAGAGLDTCFANPGISDSHFGDKVCKLLEEVTRMSSSRYQGHLIAHFVENARRSIKCATKQISDLMITDEFKHPWLITTYTECAWKCAWKCATKVPESER